MSFKVNIKLRSVCLILCSCLSSVSPALPLPPAAVACRCRPFFCLQVSHILNPIHSFYTLYFLHLPRAGCGHAHLARAYTVAASRPDRLATGITPPPRHPPLSATPSGNVATITVMFLPEASSGCKVISAVSMEPALWRCEIVARRNERNEIFFILKAVEATPHSTLLPPGFTYLSLCLIFNLFFPTLLLHLRCSSISPPS